ncbi:MAG: hypothetical protein HMLKMBBP_03164 [Planctomycetes bacterium]|nr:hypothetical protein [Planctomycetota bacterium]
MSDGTFSADLHAGLALGLTWLAIPAIWVQTARGGGALAPIRVSEETAAAGRLALRRSVLLAAVLSAAVAGAWAMPGGLVQELLLRSLVFASIPVVTFIGARPLMTRGVNDAARSDAPESVRTASLVARDENAIPAWWWAAPSALLVGGAAAVIVRWPGGGTGALAVSMLSAAASFFAAFGWWATTPRRFRHDLSGARDPAALDAACRAFGRFLSRSIFVVMTLAVGVFAGAAAFAALGSADGSRGALLGWIGGLGGCLVGLGGAVFGTLADRHRRAILELGGTPPDWSARRPRADCRGASAAGERS